MKLLIDIIGWSGSVMVIAAYGLNSYQKIKSDSLIFLFFNLTGGVFLIIYSVYYTAYANTFINVVWVIIAIPALIKLMSKK
ncbi:MAG: CBU_0592 family membrane protein [Cyclobacteriaceae bacterium]